MMILKVSSGIWGRKWSIVGNGEGLGQMVMWEHLMQCALFCLRHLFRKHQEFEKMAWN
jgi:hypothetical protein